MVFTVTLALAERVNIMLQIIIRYEKYEFYLMSTNHRITVDSYIAYVCVYIYIETCGWVCIYAFLFLALTI